jgi:putative DNA primase/helicase
MRGLSAPKETAERGALRLCLQCGCRVVAHRTRHGRRSARPLGREIYQRGGLIVRPVLTKLKASDGRDTETWRLIPVTLPYLVETLTAAAQFLKYDARTKAFMPCDAPEKVAETYLAREGSWRLQALTGVCNAPLLRVDGSICDQPGYDAASGMLFKPEGERFALIPQYPSKADAAAALQTLESLIETFPFVTDADRSVMLSAILTGLDRRAMPTAPLHGFTSPVPGSGKSLLVDIISMLSTGRRMPVIGQGRKEEELEKRLGAALLAGDAAISIDNCDHTLESSFLCQALTQERLKIRLLGFSKIVDTPNNAAIFATGNNLTLAGDLIRRALLCSLDPKCEHPEERQFKDIIAHIKAHRDALVAAALTVLRAWHIGGEKGSDPSLGSFEVWSHRIRAPLLWLGRADPCATMAKVRADDPVRGALATLRQDRSPRLRLRQTPQVASRRWSACRQ